MSTTRAIEGVTLALTNILRAAAREINLGPEVVKAVAPDKVRDGSARPPQLNLFLYHAAIDPHWRNVDAGKGAGAFPLALELSYLVTAFGENDQEASAHRLLGSALRALHDQPLLLRDRLREALRDAGLHEQIERVRITPEPLSIDDMYKLWSSFQTAYRPSAAFQARIVQIESRNPEVSPLPVLRRGVEDRGVRVAPNTLPPVPALECVRYPNGQTAALPGDAVQVEGARLDEGSLAFRVRQHRRRFERSLLPEPGGSSTRVELRIPASGVPSGQYELEAFLTLDGRTQTTGSIPLVLAPAIVSLAASPAGAASGAGSGVGGAGSGTGAGTSGSGSGAGAGARVRITVRLAPSVPPERPVDLVVGRAVVRFDWPVAAGSPAAAREEFSFELPLEHGDYWVRVRVDGVESLLVDRSDPDRPVFDPAHRVHVAPAGGGS